MRPQTILGLLSLALPVLAAPAPVAAKRDSDLAFGGQLINDIAREDLKKRGIDKRQLDEVDEVVDGVVVEVVNTTDDLLGDLKKRDANLEATLSDLLTTLNSLLDSLKKRSIDKRQVAEVEEVVDGVVVEVVDTVGDVLGDLKARDANLEATLLDLLNTLNSLLDDLKK